MLRKRNRRHQEHEHEKNTALDRVLKLLREIRDAVRKLSVQPAPETLRLSVTAVAGRSSVMSVKPVSPLTLSDTEKVQLSLAPKLANGSDDPGPFTWVSDNPAVAQVVGVDADGNADPTNTSPTGPVVWVLTPADDGSATITVTSASANVDGNSIVLTILEGTPGSVNLSAGAPIPD